jgi:hypothetical protein
MPWNIEDFDLDDPINREIWEHSPALQRGVHSQTDENGNPRFSGDFGCQQAMLGDAGFDEDPLPWVSDLVGKNYGNKGSLLIVGSTYAPFIRGIGNTGERNAIPRLAYRWASAMRPGDFQELFFDEVIHPDTSYYSQIERLLGGIGENSFLPRKYCLTDLCKGSFVERTEVDVDPHPNEPHYFSYETARRDRFEDQIFTSGQSIYHSYVSQERSMRWLWKRLQHGKVKAILALGRIAEHGVLKLMADHGCTSETTLRDNFAGGPLTEANPNAPWVSHYAHNDWRLGNWEERDDSYWKITKRNREWRMLPIYHPSRHQTYWTERYLAAIRARIPMLFE